MTKNMRKRQPLKDFFERQRYAIDFDKLQNFVSFDISFLCDSDKLLVYARLSGIPEQYDNLLRNVADLSGMGQWHGVCTLINTMPDLHRITICKVVQAK